MSILLGAAVIGAGAALLTLVARRERRRILAVRRGLLDGCRPLFEEARLTHGHDGFPVLEGRVGGARIHVALISDTMTIRRLPQLWLSVTRLEPIAVASGLAVLARPTGAEFFSMTQHFHAFVPAPRGLPPEILLRGETDEGEAALRGTVPVIAGILADAAVKEVAITRKGLRVVRQVAEGRRGDYLLLRQCAFDIAAVDPGVMLALVDRLGVLRERIGAVARLGQPALDPRQDLQ